MASGSSSSADALSSNSMERLSLSEMCDAKTLAAAPTLCLAVLKTLNFDDLGPAAQVVLVDRMLSSDQIEAALLHANRGLVMHGRPDMLIRLSAAMVQLDRLDDLAALIESRAAYGRKAERAIIERLRGILQEERGNRKDAARRFKDAAAFGDRTSLLLLADLKAEWKRFSREDVASAYRRAMKAGVVSAGGRYAIYLLDEDSDDVILEAARAAKWSIGRGDIDALVPFGQALAGLRMDVLAEAAFNDALSLGSVDAAPAYVQFLYLEGRRDEAKRWLAARHGALTSRESAALDALVRAYEAEEDDFRGQ